MIGGLEVSDPNSRSGSKFRLRFRVPYPLYRVFSVPPCSREGKNVFQEHRKSVIPTEFKILIALWILASAHDKDTMSKLSEVPQSTCSLVFHKLIKNFSRECFSEWVFILRDPDLRRVMDVYKLLDFNGAFDSIDCTHVAWRKCLVSLANFGIGKEKTPNLSFLCVVVTTSAS